MKKFMDINVDSRIKGDMTKLLLDELRKIQLLSNSNSVNENSISIIRKYVFKIKEEDIHERDI